MVDCTHGGIRINLPFPHFGGRYRVGAEPFLVTKLVEPMSYFLIHFHVIQRKKAQLHTIEMEVLVKVNFGPVL